MLKEHEVSDGMCNDEYRKNIRLNESVDLACYFLRWDM